MSFSNSAVFHTFFIIIILFIYLFSGIKKLLSFVDTCLYIGADSRNPKPDKKKTSSATNRKLLPYRKTSRANNKDFWLTQWSIINLCFCWVYTCNGKSQSGSTILVTRYLAAPNLNFKGLLAKEHANLPPNVANDSVDSKKRKVLLYNLRCFAVVLIFYTRMLKVMSWWDYSSGWIWTRKVCGGCLWEYNLRSVQLQSRVLFMQTASQKYAFL